MSIFKKIGEGVLGNLLDTAKEVVDDVVTSPEERQKATQELNKTIVGGFQMYVNAAEAAKQAEMKGNVLQRNWRPIVMLTFTALLVVRFTGIATVDIDPTLEERLMDIIEFGLGGYVLARSGEKIAGILSQNNTIALLKKKDRAKLLD